MTPFPLLRTAVRTAVVLFASVSVAWPCTGIMLTGTDGSIIRARTAEWGPFDLETKINIIPRGIFTVPVRCPTASRGQLGRARFGMVGISMLDHGAPADGINEAGLTAGLHRVSRVLPDQADNTIPGDLLAVLSCHSSRQLRKHAPDLRPCMS